MRKKNRKKTVAAMGATTTSKDWGFGPVPCKGGKTRNSLIGGTMIHREMKEAGKN
jgi:hypothetical protein